MKQIKANLGEHVVHLVVRGLREARHLKQPVELIHNDRVIVANPDDGEDETYERFMDYGK